MTSSPLLAAGIELLEREAALLDERRFDEWLALYLPDCEYWVPAWRADGTPTGNPQIELSHLYCASRAALEDRVVRIRSGRSPASTPAPRTTTKANHNPTTRTTKMIPASPALR